MDVKVYQLRWFPRWGWVRVGAREPKPGELDGNQGPVGEAIRWLRLQP